MCEAADVPGVGPVNELGQIGKHFSSMHWLPNRFSLHEHTLALNNYHSANPSRACSPRTARSSFIIKSPQRGPLILSPSPRSALSAPGLESSSGPVIGIKCTSAALPPRAQSRAIPAHCSVGQLHPAAPFDCAPSFSTVDLVVNWRAIVYGLAHT